MDFIPKISVIVPIYNAEQYLSRCIDSILAQSFSNFELLLIDDGSIDDSSKICNWYLVRDRRIRVFHKNNGGVSSARNLGLNNAKGEWVCFCDADDYVGKDWLNNFYPLDMSKGDLRVQGYEIVGDNERKLIEVHSNFYCSKAEILRNFIEETSHNNIYMVPWNKMYMRSIIKDNNIYFEESISLGEDYLFTLNYLKYVNTINIINSSEYKYINLNSTLTKKLDLVSMMLVRFYKVKEVCRILAEQVGFYDFYYYNLSQQFLSLFRRAFRTSCAWRDKGRILNMYKIEKCSCLDAYIKFPYSIITKMPLLSTNLSVLVLTVLFKTISIFR